MGLSPVRNVRRKAHNQKSSLQSVWLIWFLPAIILFAWNIIKYRKLLHYFHTGSQEIDDIILRKEFEQLIEQNKIRRRISLSINSTVMSPVMIGLFHPCIILPASRMTAEEFRHTISHELMHYKRKDILYKWLTKLTVCIHWFNPLVYKMERNINKACELSCDEAVIWNLNEQERYAYGDTLLRVAGKNIKYKEPISPLSFSSNAKNLKERLGAIMHFQKLSKVTSFIMISATIGLFVCSSYIGVYAASKQKMTVADAPKQKEMVVDTPKRKAAAGTPKQKATTAGTPKQKTTAADAPKANTTWNSHASQAPHTVIYQNGEYFILFGHAKEKDLPGSTGSDYGVTFGAVWPDAYISFNSYYVNKELSSNIKKDCKHFQNKKWLTKKEANAIIDVANQVQHGNTKDFLSSKQETEYAQWNIILKNGAYYYKNTRVRILMDTRKDRSFKNFSYDAKGKTDIKVVRHGDNKITGITYLSKEKAQKIIEDLK